MPVEIKFANVPMGIAAKHAREGEKAVVVVREFSSSEDGNLFISRLEGLPRTLISMIPGATHNWEATVDHLFAVIRPNKTATVYLNDLPHTLRIRAKRPINKGEAVTLDDMLDVQSIDLQGLHIPADAGVVVILSAGWRKGLFFDLEPLLPTGPKRTYDIESTLGQYYAYLNFQQLFSMSDAVWDAFFAAGWFPFSHLQHETIRKMIKWAEAGYSLDEHLDQITTEVKSWVGRSLEKWKAHPIIEPHHDFLVTAYHRFLDDDFLSATSILFPKIEGILRSHHFSEPSPPKASQTNLVNSAISRAELPQHPNSLLLPGRFRLYMNKVYFADFDPRNPKGLSRNTVSHGVAPQSAFDRKSAVLGFLILLQIASLLPITKPKT